MQSWQQIMCVFLARMLFSSTAVIHELYDLCLVDLVLKCPGSI